MRPHLSTFAVAVALVLVPWAIVGMINAAGATTETSAVQHVLHSGGPRGRLIGSVLYAIPAILLGGAAGFVLGHDPLARVFVWLGALSLIAWLNLKYLVAATEHWPTKLLSGQDVLVVSRLAQVVFFVGIGMLFGCGAKANIRDARRNVTPGDRPNGGS